MTGPHRESQPQKAARASACRFCGAGLSLSFVDLGSSPLCQKHVPLAKAQEAEPFFPLHAFVCTQCYLVQLDEFVVPSEIFGDGEYAYFASFSDSWLAHARRYVDTVSERFGLGKDSFVIEIASNDGYLLQNFVARGVPVLGIEPASNCAAAAREKGVESRVCFFGSETARQLVREGKRPDLLLGNNVLAHVPDVNDFVSGMQALLKETGVLTLEFPHLVQLIAENQFDTIYHEHFSYFSFTTVRRIFARHGLRLFDVEQLPTHGGSLRIYGCQQGAAHADTQRVGALLAREAQLGVESTAYYQSFAEQVRETKRGLLEFLIGVKRQGSSVVGYGAPGKGNTLLNYCGIRRDFIDYTVDRSPHKQNNLLPGSRIPIYAPEKIFETKPDYLLILPWNLREEIMSQMAGVRQWGGKFVVPIPSVKVFE
jgi:C-methyltransferase C-terminal domain/Putative zinc binding domain/Methyltransferase domain